MTKKQPLYLALAVLRSRHHNLSRQLTFRHEVLSAVESEISRLVREYMPSGSGFDRGTVFVTACVDAALKPVLRFTTYFHHMDEHGGYDGWTHHTVKVEADFDGLRITVTGSNRNDIKDYIADAFHTALTQEVLANTGIMSINDPLPREEDPSQCPQCNSADVLLIRNNFEGTEATQRLTCARCGCRWVATYHLASRVVLENGCEPKEGT